MTNLDALIANPGLLTAGRTYAQVLLDTRNLLSEHDRWNQGTFAVTADGQSTNPTDQEACRWCLLGAMARCSSDLGIIPPQLLRFVEGMMHFVYGDQFATIGEMNDYIDHQSLINFVDQCIRRFG